MVHNSDLSSDDEVFFELDVVLNPQTGPGELNLFQYPLRPADRPYSDGGNTLKGAAISVPVETDTKFSSEQIPEKNLKLTFELNQ